MKQKLVLVFAVVFALLLFVGQPSAEAKSYTVRPGDTVFLIAQRHGTTLQAVLEMNSLPNPHLIYPGRTINLPATYTVKPGDTVFLIAQRHGTTLSKILSINNFADPNLIYPGQVITLPVTGGESASNAGVSVPVSATASRSGNYSATDLDLFARLVHAEAGGEPYIGQVAVAATILNRVASPRFPNTLRGVILQLENGYYQYSPVLDGRINIPANDSAWRAVHDALNGQDPSLGATGFYNPRKTSNQWVRQQPVTTVIGNHVFLR